MLITNFGKNSAGTKAPHKKLLPKAITFTIPLTASLLRTNELMKKAVNEIGRAHV